MFLLSSIFVASLVAQVPDGGEIADAGATLDAGTSADSGVPKAFATLPAQVVPLLQVWAADAGTAFSAPSTGEVRTVELSPGDYSLQLGRGPTTKFTLAEGGNVAVQGTGFTLQGVWPEGTELPFQAALPTLRTVKRKGWGEVTLGFGVTRPPSIPSGYTGAFNVLYALTDRLQLNVPFPHLSYVFGDIGDSEWVIEGGVPLASYDRSEKFILLSASAGRRSYWRAEGSWIVGVEATSYLSWGPPESYEPRPLRSFGYTTGRVQAGVAMTFGRRVTINIGVSANDSVLQAGTRIQTFPLREPFAGAPSISIGSVLRLAGRDLPLVQVHLTRRLSVDLWSTGALGWNLRGSPRAEPTPGIQPYLSAIAGVTYTAGGWN